MNNKTEPNLFVSVFKVETLVPKKLLISHKSQQCTRLYIINTHILLVTETIN